MSLLLIGCIVAMSSAVLAVCSSEQTMYGHKQSNRGTTVKSNIKVKGNGKNNIRSTRNY